MESVGFYSLFRPISHVVPTAMPFYADRSHSVLFLGHTSSLYPSGPAVSSHCWAIALTFLCGFLPLTVYYVIYKSNLSYTT